MTEQWKNKSARFGWLAGAIAGAALTASLVSINHDSAAQPAAAQPVSVRGAASPASFADVIESVSPAVVNIMVSKVEQAQPTAFNFEDRGQGPRGQRAPQTPFDEFFGRFFDQPNQPRRERRRVAALGALAKSRQRDVEHRQDLRGIRDGRRRIRLRKRPPEMQRIKQRDREEKRKHDRRGHRDAS